MKSNFTEIEPFTGFVSHTYFETPGFRVDLIYKPNHHSQFVKVKIGERDLFLARNSTFIDLVDDIFLFFIEKGMMTLQKVIETIAAESMEQGKEIGKKEFKSDLKKLFG